MPRPRKDVAVTPLPNEPDFVITPPGVVLEGRRGEGLHEVETSVWVKLSVRFREVLHEFEDSMLHVFLAVALHVDRDNKSFPSLATIEQETGFEKQAITRSIKRLEEAGFLTVHHRNGHSSVFEVNSYVAMGKDNNPKTPYHDNRGFSETPHHDNGGLGDTPYHGDRVEVELKNLRRLIQQEQKIYIVSLVLAAVCEMNYDANKKRLLGAAKDLVNSCDANPERVLRDYGKAGLWYEQDWRGQKKQPPNLATIKETWGKFHPNASGVVQPGQTNIAADGGFYV